jgi:hypothetical protein
MLGDKVELLVERDRRTFKVVRLPTDKGSAR